MENIDVNEHSKKQVYNQKASTQREPVEFSSAADIQASLRSQDVGILIQGLTTLRNQWRIQINEGIPSTQDHRLLLVKSWLEVCPAAKDIFSILHKQNKPTPNIIGLCLGVLSNVLDLLSSHYIYHSLGLPILKNLQSPANMRLINANIGEGNFEVASWTVKLLNSMSSFGGGIEKRAIMDNFAWGQKAVRGLLFQRRKVKGGQKKGLRHQLDIRTSFIDFLLSFLAPNTPSTLKLILLEQHRDTFLLIFKGIHQDSYPVIRRILETCWEGIWNDNKIKRTLKVGLFNESTLNNLLKLYDRKEPDDESQDYIPANLIHHFMLAIMTHPGVGVCFKDRGWYHRESTADDIVSDSFDTHTMGGNNRNKLFNKILANILKVLKLNEDPRQQELAFKILGACPELVTSFWGSVNLTLEPRLASRWITNISILGTIISSPIPLESFYLPNTSQLDPSPPPLDVVTANVLPLVLNKVYLTKGLQSSSSLVQLCTTLALTKCLAKYQRVLITFREIAAKLEERGESGQWLKRVRELEYEVEKRVPEFTVVVGMVQQKPGGSSSKLQIAKEVLLTESGLRLLWFYQKLLSRMVINVKFDVGKLLLNILSSSGAATGNEGQTAFTLGDNRGFDLLRQLRVLRILQESDQFGWLNRFGTSPHTNLHAILTLYSTTSIHPIRQGASDLITSLLASSILFSHDPSEINFWLQSLPTNRRSPNAVGPDDTPLGNEIASVLLFLDDCIQRCSKTFYRYLEDSVKFYEDGDIQGVSLRNEPRAFPSPLLMVVFEQLKAKIISSLLRPSDVLAIVTFIRKLGISLTSKTREIQNIQRIHDRLYSLVDGCNAHVSSEVIRRSIIEERELMAELIAFIDNPAPHNSNAATAVVQEFLDRIASLPSPTSMDEAIHRAYELVDWARMIDVSLHPLEAKRLFDIILQHCPAAGVEFLYHLHPLSGQFWDIIENQENVLFPILPFELAYIHTTSDNMMKASVRQYLATMFISGFSWNRPIERRVSIAVRRLVNSRKSLRQTEVHFLIEIFDHIRSKEYGTIRLPLKRAIFMDSEVIELACSWENLSHDVIGDLVKLVEVALEPSVLEDQELSLPYTDYWVALCHSCSDLSKCMGSLPWLSFMKPQTLLDFLDVVITTAKSGSSKSFDELEQKFVNVILHLFSVRSVNNSWILVELTYRASDLISLKGYLHEVTIVDALLLRLLEARFPFGSLAFPAYLDLPVPTASYVSTIAEVQWQNKARGVVLDEGLLTGILTPGYWVPATAKTVAAILYHSPSARRTFWSWISDDKVPQIYDNEHLLFPLHAYLDAVSISRKRDVEDVRLPNIWIERLAKGVFSYESPDVSYLCSQCVKLGYQLCHPSSQQIYIVALSKEIARNHPVRVSVVKLFYTLREIGIGESAVFMDAVMKWILQWMMGCFTGEEIIVKDISVLNELSELFRGVESKADLVEPVVKAAIQNCLHIPSAIETVVPLLKTAHFKPVTVNRLLQCIVQHKQLFHSLAISSQARKPVVRLLHTLFHLHPANTCQVSHITPLPSLYGGTLSTSDQLLFSIFHLFEKQRKESTASLFHGWTSSSASNSTSHNVLDAIINLDANKVFRSCTRFPTRRTFNYNDLQTRIDDETIYDPLFLCLLTVQFLVEYKVLSTRDWVQVFRTNVFSFLICLLMSRDLEIRKLGATSLGALFKRLEIADFQEKMQVVYVLDLLRDLLPSPSSTTKHARLPAFSILFFAHALRSIFYPSSFLYPIMSRFLLQRPEFDMRDVPMLYSSLYSSEGGEWQKERTWILKFLTSVMNDGSAQDFAIFRRRHTWDLLASIWQASKPEEKLLRKCIFEFLANLSSNQHGAASLLFRSFLLSWIEAQLHSRLYNDQEYLAWAKIIENVIVTIDHGKAEKAMQGQYGIIIVRCLQLILDFASVSEKCSTSTKLSALFLVSRASLRIAQKGGTSATILLPTLQNCIKTLRELEKSIHISSRGDICAVTFPEAPHQAISLFDEAGSAVDENAFALHAWKTIVVILWRVTMEACKPCMKVEVEIWNMVTCRIFVLGAIFRDTINDEDSKIVQWARLHIMADLVA